jgi:hypothetical protein
MRMCKFERAYKIVKKSLETADLKAVREIMGVEKLYRLKNILQRDGKHMYRPYMQTTG